MKNTIRLLAILFFLLPALSFAQSKDSLMVAAIINEANTNSQLKNLAHELMDGIGPRLVGSPKMQQAHDWAVAKYSGWGVAARNEKWGEWRGWERGISHIDMVQPWIKTLEGTQLAWSPSTGGKSITAELIILADVADSIALIQWLPNVKGKFVMISMMQPTGRPDYNWQEFGTKESVEKMKQERTEQTDAWRKRISKTGLSNKNLALALEKAGAVGIVGSNWSAGFGVNKFLAPTKRKFQQLILPLKIMDSFIACWNPEKIQRSV